MIRRWRDSAYARLGQVHDLMRVLMKPRNGVAWTEEDKAFLWREIRHLARWTPAVVLFLLPGGSLLLPALAWTLDRRRHRPGVPSLAERRSPGGWAT